MFIELHIIQNFAPSNLNRDDTNNPKECEFGGVRRARISSQCLKRASREAPVFARTTAAENGTRTRWLTRRLRQPLLAAGKPEADVDAVVAAFATAYSGKMDKKTPERTSVLLYLSLEEIKWMANALLENWDVALAVARPAKGKKVDVKPLKPLVDKLVKETKNRTSAPDIALFGRMLADKPVTNLDAACQVAHAISTHRVAMEVDFFTAVDELLRTEEPGAGMMGTVGFNSACFYRYARIDWRQLLTNLDDDVALARRTVEGFLRAAEAAIPSGKQNSFAAHSRPSFLLGVVREDGMGWSLANAFEKSVYPQREASLVGASVAALDAYWNRLCTVYGIDTLNAVAALDVDPGLQLSETLQSARVPDFAAFVQTVTQALPQE